MTNDHKTSQWRQQAALGAGVLMALLLLGEDIAEARSTSSSAWGVKPKTYTQYLQLCKSRPDIPACRTASFYFGKLASGKKVSRVKHFYSHVRLSLALRKASRQRFKEMDRARNNHRSYWRRMWSSVRFKMVALSGAMSGRTKAAAAVQPAERFSNTGGFGQHVERSASQQRSSWVYKRGRLAAKPGFNQAKTKKTKAQSPFKRDRRKNL